jgi:hypothetical protein
LAAGAEGRWPRGRELLLLKEYERIARSNEWVVIRRDWSARLCEEVDFAAAIADYLREAVEALSVKAKIKNRVTAATRALGGLLSAIVAAQDDDENPLPVMLVLCGLPLLTHNLHAARSNAERLFRAEEIANLSLTVGAAQELSRRPRRSCDPRPTSPTHRASRSESHATSTGIRTSFSGSARPCGTPPISIARA